MNRRELLRMGGVALVAGGSADLLVAEPEKGETAGPVERWGIFEVALPGPASGNPFLDVWFKAIFRLEHQSQTVDGFYDGKGVYKVRFMPGSTGNWTFETDSNIPALKGKRGSFRCTPASENNHGPVMVQDTFHFAHADGKAFFPIGTTCYAWVHQTETLQEETLHSLRTAPFNKIRMCVFPKWYQYNHREPPFYPFPRKDGKNDLDRFDPDFFAHIEKRLAQLSEMNIQADLILFHPYDHWGYQEMPAEVDDRYLRYVIARFAAFRNVWWSLANEFDLMRKKTAGDWERFAAIVTQTDPYAHLRSIHYSKAPYDYSRVWCTHATVQDYAFDKAAGWRADWRKPVIFDECMYEGNINSRWGNLSGEEMTRRFWLCTVAGVYAGHGETYVSRNEIENDQATLWWSHGGTLKGTSPARLAFLGRLLDLVGQGGGDRIGFEAIEPTYYLVAKRSQNEALLWYFDFHQPSYYDFMLPEKQQFRATWIDPWGMTMQDVPGVFTGRSRIDLPGRPYQAILFRKV